MKLLQLLQFSFLLLALSIPFANAAQEQQVEQKRHKDEDLRAFNEKLSTRDFSIIWTIKKLPFSLDYMNNIRPEPLGYIGEHFQRFRIHFSAIRQDKYNPQQYFVEGKTNVKDNICDFTGVLMIQAVDCGPPFTLDPRCVDGEILGPRTFRSGTIRGTYELKENPKQQYTGVLKGTFTSSFLINEQGRIDYNFLGMYSDNYNNNQFEGTWIPYNSQKAKVCNWGDYRIPNSQALDIGAGEFSPVDKFLLHGWQTYREAYHTDDELTRQTALQKEGEEWWK